VSDKHDEIAERVAKVFIDKAYVHTFHQGHEWSIGVDTVEMTYTSLQAAMALALAAFAREYGLTPASYYERPTP
jgi:hypothetical protein